MTEVHINLEIYIKPLKKVMIYEQEKIRLGDIAEVHAPNEIQDKVKKTILLEISSPAKPNYLITFIDIINVVDKAFPGHTISNVGEIDTIVDYFPKKIKENAVWKWSKIAFIALLLFVGSATAIMSFQSDAQIPEIFKNYYRLFFNEDVEKTPLIDIPYSIGLALGIMIFFNHFFGKKINDSPTPMEIEMSLYEINVSDTVIDVLGSKRLEKSNN